MPAIGHVTKQGNGGYKGQLKTLTIRADIDIVPNAAKSADNQPDFRVLTKGSRSAPAGCGRARPPARNTSR